MSFVYCILKITDTAWRCIKSFMVFGATNIADRTVGFCIAGNIAFFFLC